MRLYLITVNSFKQNKGCLIWSLLPSHAVLIIGNDIFTHAYFVQRICICSGAGNWKVDSSVKSRTSYSNLLLLLLLFSRPVFQQRGWNNSYSNLDAFGWNGTSGCSPCTGLPLCSKRISRACSWRVRYPTTSFFFFFTSLCLCSPLFVCSSPNLSRTTLFLPFLCFHDHPSATVA